MRRLVYPLLSLLASMCIAGCGTPRESQQFRMAGAGARGLGLAATTPQQAAAAGVLGVLFDSLADDSAKLEAAEAGRSRVTVNVSSPPPNLVRSSGRWRPAKGYTWIDATSPTDLRVRPIISQRSRGGTVWAAYFDSGNKAYKDQRYPEAERLFKAAVSAAEEFGTDDIRLAFSLTQLGNANWYLGKYPEAGALYERAVQCYERALRPNHPALSQPLGNLGMVKHHTAAFAEAEALYERALSIAESARAENEFGQASLIAHLSNLASLYIDQSKYELAEPLLLRAKAILQRTEESGLYLASILNNLGLVYTHKKQFAQAESVFNRSRQIYGAHPDAGIVITSLAKLYAAREDYRRALGFYEEAVARLADNHFQRPSTLRQYGICLYLLEKYAEAEEVMREIIESESANDDDRLRLVKVLGAQEKYSAASDVVRELVRKSPDNGQLRNQLAWYLFKAGDLAHARQMAEAAVQLDPDFAYAQGTLGSILRAQGNIEEAIVRFEAATRLAPDDDSIQSYDRAELARCHARNGDAARAFEESEHAQAAYRRLGEDDEATAIADEVDSLLGIQGDERGNDNP